MCIVVDTNRLASVLKKRTADHEEFKPILNWIVNGRGAFVIGGTKYLCEAIGFVKIFSELAKVNKVITINKQEVDREEAWAANQIHHPDFDDPHIIALLRVSGCKLICSSDARAYPFFKNKKFFSPVAKRPKIYSQKRNAALLIDANIADCCVPCKLAEKVKEELIQI